MINKYAIGMVDTPKKALRKSRSKKSGKEQEVRPIGEVFPKVTSATLSQLQNFYKMGLSARLTSTQPGMPGRKTTQGVFRYLDEELLKEYDIDANQRQKLAKQKNKESFERMLLKLEIALAKVELILSLTWDKYNEDATTLAQLTPPELPKPFTINGSDERLRISLITSILETRDHIAGNEYTLTIHEADEKAIIEHLEKKVAKLTT